MDRRRHRRLTVVIVMLGVTSMLGRWLGEQHRVANPEVQVIDTLDGDTIVVAFPDGHADTIRILGVDTPETHHPRKPVQCFGPEAAEYTRSRLLGRTVRLEDDVETRDLYGRHLAYVYLDGHRFDDELIERGYARLLVIAPNTAHARTMLAEELDAQRRNRGLWGEC